MSQSAIEILQFSELVYKIKLSKNILCNKGNSMNLYFSTKKYILNSKNTVNVLQVEIFFALYV